MTSTISSDRGEHSSVVMRTRLYHPQSMNWIFSVIVAAVLLVGLTVGNKSCATRAVRTGHMVTAKDVQQAHGLKIPSSARNFQQVRVGGSWDHGVLSLFEVDQSGVEEFLSQLQVKSRSSPVKLGVGDPCVNGYNVWPTNSPTFVPGNEELDVLKPTWTGEAEPIEMLSCSSPKGDWLHVEIWSVGNHSLVKLYTDWN